MKGSFSRGLATALATGVSIGVGIAATSAPLAAHAGANESGPRASASAAAPVQVLKPLTMRRGRDAALPYLRKNVIHLPSGRTIKVRVPFTGHRLQLLGRAAGGGFLVAAGVSHANKPSRGSVYKVSRGRTPVRIARAGFDLDDGSYTSIRLSRDGRQLAVTNFNRGGSDTIVRSALTGRVIQVMDSSSFFRPIDFADGKLLTWKEGDERNGWQLKPVVWTVKGPQRELPGHAWGGFLRHNLYFTGTERAGGGPTSLSAPSAPAWQARFRPVDLSPDARSVLGNRPGRAHQRSVLEVRRMSDGALLRTLSSGPTLGRQSSFAVKEQTARFETANRYVFQASTKKGQVLVRCRLDSRRCTRASAVGGPFSFAHEDFLW